MPERTRARGWTPGVGRAVSPGVPETCLAMAEGAAGREGPAPLDAAGGEDDPRVAADAASGDAAPAVSGGRMRDRRSGVALPGAAGAPGDSEAGLLEAARATPRRSSIIKVSGAAAAQSMGVGVGEIGDPGRMFIAPGIAGWALFSPTSFTAKPSCLVRRFPDSALGLEKQK